MPIWSRNYVNIPWTNYFICFVFWTMHLGKGSKKHIQNLVQSSAGIPLDFLYVHPETFWKCIVQKNKIKQFVLGWLIFLLIIPRLIPRKLNNNWKFTYQSSKLIIIVNIHIWYYIPVKELFIVCWFGYIPG